MKNKIHLILLCFTILLSCAKNGNGEADPAKVATIMNENMQLPPGSFTVDPDNVSVDNTIIMGTSSGVTPIESGPSMNNEISFTAPNGNVNAVGMRFGTSGPIYFVPINTNGATSGTGTFPFAINSDICADLSSICHDIKCYEFAQTSAGSISKANIRDVAMLCGNCDEPSCSGLVDPSDCNTTPGQGSGTFTLSGVSGSLSGDAFCNTTLSISSASNQLIVSNAGSSGSVSFTSDYYIGGNTSSPAIQVTTTSGETYIAVSGSGSWSGNTFTLNASMKTIVDAVSGGGSSKNLTATISCN
jgi:hypothetical protein